MRHCCRWTLLILLIIVIVLLGGYYGMGVKTQSQFNRLVAMANRSPNVKIVIDSYHRRWFTSKAVLDVTLHKPAEEEMIEGKLQITPARDFNFKLNTKIYHGPIIFSGGKVAFGLGYAKANVPVPQKTLEQFDQDFVIASKNTPSVTASVFLRYNSSSVTTLGVPAFKLTEKQGGGVLEWNGISSNWHISSNLQHVSGGVDFLGAKFTNASLESNVGPVTLDYKVVENNYGIWSGDATLDFPSLDVNINGQKKLALSQLKFATTSTVNEDLLDSSFKATLQKLVVNDASYGPGNLDIALRRLDAQALKDIQQLLQSNQNANLTREEQQMLMMSLLPKISQLINKGAEFEIRQLTLAMPEGDFKMTAKVSLPQGKNGAPVNPLMLLEGLQANANIQVPASLLQQALANTLKTRIIAKQMAQKQTQQTAAAAPAPASATQTSTMTAGSHSSSKPATTAATTASAPAALSEPEIIKMANEQSQQELDHLIAAGIIVKSDKIYVIAINYQSGKLTVNGKPFDKNMLK